ncbi:MAG TPA: hypothetical protein DD761_20105 [Cyanobacteria bacterium UBA11691]|nr:hypothetical protein [Cyanobacteria bacterium UBA11691]
MKEALESLLPHYRSQYLRIAKYSPESARRYYQLALKWQKGIFPQRKKKRFYKTLTPEEKQLCIEARKSGKSYHAINNNLGIGRRMVQRIMKEYGL